jgi:hypothetical protein
VKHEVDRVEVLGLLLGDHFHVAPELLEHRVGNRPGRHCDVARGREDRPSLGRSNFQKSVEGRSIARAGQQFGTAADIEFSKARNFGYETMRFVEDSAEENPHPAQTPKFQVRGLIVKKSKGLR